MSGDEIVVLVLATGVAVALWGSWFYQALRVRGPHTSFWARRLVVYLAPALCALLLYWVLRRYASHDVRDSAVYTTFYMIIGAAWVAVTVRVLNLLGLHTRDDILERGNSAAALAIGGGLLGLAFCFAGGNVGDGPGWWVVIFAALLSTTTFFVLWCVLVKLTGITEAITIDRDPASGLRASGYFVANGVILGRAVAGNWISAQTTLEDFVTLGWPALVLTGAAIVLEFLFRPTPRQPQPSTFLSGLPVFLICVAAAFWYLRIKS
jgi:uncharacterized membrane protein YjfL (UPF0719 family)